MLFGERVQVIEIDKNGWVRAITEWEEYIGWICESQLHIMDYKEYSKPLHHISYARYDTIIAKDGSFVLSPGSSLFRLRKKTFLWDKQLAFKGIRMKLKLARHTQSELKKLAYYYIGSPYEWGGRNLMGIDCSGFTQMVYKMMNIRLPRDAYQQAEVGETVGFLASAKCGDLAFFDNEEGRITHVGILLDNTTIIHATESSGRVVVDAIDNGGIISTRLRKRTHNLRLIKRITDLK